MQVPCDWCGKEHYRRPSHVYEHNFCSKGCFRAWIQRDKPRLVCEWCGGEYLVPPCRKDMAKFCSPECYQEWRKEHWIGMRGEPAKAVACDWCGATFLRCDALLKDREHHFCDTTCMGKWREENIVGENHPLFLGGGELYYGANWRRQRRKARQRDGYACLRCGVTSEEIGRELDVHHYQPFREFGLARYKEANELSNLGSFCPSCHKLVEGMGEDWR